MRSKNKNLLTAVVAFFLVIIATHLGSNLPPFEWPYSYYNASYLEYILSALIGFFGVSYFIERKAAKKWQRWFQTDKVEYKLQLSTSESNANSLRYQRNQFERKAKKFKKRWKAQMKANKSLLTRFNNSELNVKSYAARFLDSEKRCAELEAQLANAEMPHRINGPEDVLSSFGIRISDLPKMVKDLEDSLPEDLKAKLKKETSEPTNDSGKPGV